MAGCLEEMDRHLCNSLQGRSSATLTRSSERLAVAQAHCSAPPLSKVESLAIDSIVGTTFRGIPGGINTAAVSRSGRSLATSGGLISYSNLLLNDLSNESEISFDLNSNPRSSTPIPSPDFSQHSLQPIQIPSSQPTPEPSSQLQPSPLATQTSSRNPPARATTGSIRSSRTVTRDVRNDEFKQLLAEQKRTNDIMEELLKLKRARYASMGYISQ